MDRATSSNCHGTGARVVIVRTPSWTSEMTMSFTKTLSKWISGLDYDNVPQAAVPWVRAAVLDYFAVALAGCRAKDLQILRKYIDAQYAPGNTSLIGEKSRMSPEAAAFY